MLPLCKYGIPHPQHIIFSKCTVENPVDVVDVVGVVVGFVNFVSLVLVTFVGVVTFVDLMLLRFVRVLELRDWYTSKRNLVFNIVSMIPLPTLDVDE